MSIKQLNSRKLELEEELQQLKQRINVLQLESNKKYQELDKIKSKIKDNQAKPILSEHAILRYLERTGKLNIEEITSKIMTEKVINLIDFCINGTIPICDGMKAVIKNKTIVTVLN